MSKPKVFVTRDIFKDTLSALKKTCDFDIWSGENPPPRQIVIERAAGADGILCLLNDRIDGEIMDAAGPQLKIISNCAVGYDNIDLKAATDRGILVGNTPGILTDTTADMAFALLLAAARRLVEGSEYVKAGRWTAFRYDFLLGQDVHGAALGIIGMGRIGSAVARRARGFDMDVFYYNHHGPLKEGAPDGARYCGHLEELLAVSDFISLHVPLTEATHHLIDASVIDKMKRNAVLINTARGAVIDTDALFNALKTGRIAYAALDVTDPEPLPAGHKLLSLSNCLVVPHIGSATVATRRQMATLAVENLMAGIGGEAPPHLVNPEALPHRR